MVDFLRHRAVAMRLGVTGTLLSLIASVNAGIAQAGQPSGANTGSFNVDALAGTVATQLVKIEAKLDSSVSALEHKLKTSYMTAKVINSTFVKIRTADAMFGSLGNTYVKIVDANSTFMKVVDANAQFLKVNGTAADSSKLGGLSPSSYFQGSGSVATGSIASLQTSSSPTELFPLAGGALVISAVYAGAAGPVQLEFQNNTSVSLEAMVEGGSGPMAHQLAPQSTTAIAFPEVNNIAQLQVQLFPSAPQFPDVVTIIASVDATRSQPAVIAQAFTGPVS
jgi:hypothetical protein